MSDHSIDEETPLLHNHTLKDQRTSARTPLPKAQIAICLFLQVCEPLTSQSIYPYINQVGGQRASKSCNYDDTIPQLVSELDITGGDEKKVGYYAGLIVGFKTYVRSRCSLNYIH